MKPGVGGRAAAVVAFSLALGAAGVLVVAPWHGKGPAAAALGDQPWYALAIGALFALTSVFVAHIRFGREGQEVSLRDVAVAFGLALLSPPVYFVVHVAGAFLPRLRRRTQPVKLLFNACLFMAEAGLAVAVYRLVGAGAAPTDGRGLLAGVVAVGAADLLSVTAVNVVIRLHSGEAAKSTLALHVLGQLTSLPSAAVGLLGVVLLVREPAALPLLAVLLAVVFLAYRSQIQLAAGNDRLELLYAFTGAAGRALADDTVANTVLEQTRELMAAESAELHLPDADGVPSSVRLSEAGLERLPPLVGSAWWSPALAGKLVHRRPADAGSGPPDALAAPLYRDGEVFGCLVVVDRMGTEQLFQAHDAKVFAALAGTASVSLQNARLVARLKREATVREHAVRHDALTGLVNRIGFREAVDAQRSRGPGVVLVANLEGFRDVNDSLGQGFGDQLLVAVGARLAGRLPHAVVGRLSADEYAVLLPGRDGPGSAAQVAAALTEPFPVGNVLLPVRARTGSAQLTADGTDADLLVRRADLALHRAKRENGRAAQFDPLDESATTERLALVGDLRDALARNDLTVHYQPQLDLVTGQVCSVEALVRWTHAERGFVPPDLFIPLAESTGLVDELTDSVLRIALADLRNWRAQGLLTGVAVNLSARSLTPELPRRLSRALTAAGLPASALTLELTETAVLSDPVGAARVLADLSALGCTVSLDDFGTGYSSMSYLRTLPLDEIKVDKSFVLRMVQDPQDEAVVRSSVQLAHDLGMVVVAEGVEDEAALDLLRALGCDHAQGYFIARPMPAEAVTRWLWEYRGLRIPARTA